jgi:hypothetical protein
MILYSYLIDTYLFALYNYTIVHHYHHFYHLGTLIPDKQLWAGNPATYIRDVTEDEMKGLIKV